VERAYGPDKQSVLQRLRRLYYSSYAGAGGAQFDRVIAEQAGAGAGAPPLDAQMISPDTLDGLYETNVVLLPDGQLLDVSHVLAGLDLKTSGTTFKAATAEVGDNITMMGVVTWAGDLASWLLKYIKAAGARGEDEGPPPADPVLSAAQKVDLLSDMDAQALA